MKKGSEIFYQTMLLTGANFLLRLAGMSFQVYLSGRVGAEGIGLLQLVLSVSALSFTVGSAGIRTCTTYLSAGELGRGTAGGLSKKETLQSTPGEIGDLWELYLRAKGAKKEREPEDE